jgi:DNA-binding CsgD family transcriptional regulator
MLSLDESALFLDLHAAPFRGWAAVLARLMTMTRAQAGAIWGAQVLARAGDAPALPEGLRRERVYTEDDLGGDIGLRALRVTGGGVVLTRAGGFRATDSALLSALAPHLAQALTLWAQAEAARGDAAQSSAVMRAAGLGWARLGPGGRVLASDAPEGAIRAGRVTGTALQVTDAQGPLALIRVPVPPPPPERIAPALGLTLAEARLACALAGGLDMPSSARALGWTIETARSYSRRIYAKTGCWGQADLVRRVWTALPSVPDSAR